MIVIHGRKLYYKTPDGTLLLSANESLTSSILGRDQFVWSSIINDPRENI